MKFCLTEWIVHICTHLYTVVPFVAWFSLFGFISNFAFILTASFFYNLISFLGRRNLCTSKNSKLCIKDDTKQFWWHKMYKWTTFISTSTSVSLKRHHLQYVAHLSFRVLFEYGIMFFLPRLRKVLFKFA